MNKEQKLRLTSANSAWTRFSEPSKCRTWLYCGLVEDFSIRQFTNESDALWASAGILDATAERFPQGFIWAAPYESLDAALLWEEDVDCLAFHFRKALHTSVLNIDIFSLHYPSWSWLCSNVGVRFWSKCRSELMCEVEWMTSVRPGDELFETLSPSDEFTEAFDGAQRSQLATQAIVLKSSETTECGLLAFSALSTTLTLERAEQSHDEKYGRWGRPYKTKASVLLPTGYVLGEIDIPSAVLGLSQSRSAEFILLSSNAREESDEICKRAEGTLDHGCIIHVKDCKHIKSYNMMWIERVGRVAYRYGLFKIAKDDWHKVETVRKDIILG